MIYVYYHEHFMNTFMNTFLRVMNTMDTLRVYTYFLIKKRDTKVWLYNRVLACICPKSLHCIHQLIGSVHKSIHKAYIQSFIFGGISLTIDMKKNLGLGRS